MPWEEILWGIWALSLSLGAWNIERILRACRRWRNRLHRKPCCPSCSGRGAGGVAMVESHGGLCWDCRATGHPHKPDWWNRSA